MSMQSFIEEVEKAIASGDAARRSTALRDVTRLFLDQSGVLTADLVAVFDEVILRLARDIESKARIELSEHIADVSQSPRQVVRRLAFDQDIAVARPVIERSRGLDDDDLVTIGRERGQDHLLAMSQRETLSERVTDVIVDRGNERVVRKVARNEGARFSTAGFNQLLDKARDDSSLPDILQSRCDIPPGHIARLVDIARQRARETLAAEMGGDEAVDGAIDRIAALVAEREGSVIVDDFREAGRRVDLKAKDGRISEDDVADWIEQGRLVEAFAAMARLAQVEPSVVSRAYFARHYDPLLYLARSVRFSWSTFKLMLVSKLGHEPPEDLLRAAFTAFQALSVPTAQRVVRFVSARGKIAPSQAAA